MRPVIIGGGVAGCAIAAALRANGAMEEPVVVERRASGAPAGMGFILMPNGLDALARIAPEFDWRAAGRAIDRVSLRRADGTVIDEPEIEPAVCVSRERFLAMLREAAGGARFIEGRSVANLARDEDGDFTAIRLDDGSEIAGDVFFGCDGAQSRTRGMVFPDAALGEVVVKEIVSVADSAALAAELGTTFRKYHDEEGGFAVGLLAESDARVVWFVQFDARRWPEVDASPEHLAAFVGERIAGWPADVRAAFAATDFRRSHLWPTRDLHPLASLAEANLALVGDAAHACLPFTSQGANGALVDAALLGELLDGARTPREAAAAFARYSELRRPHHRRMFMEGRRLREDFLAPLAGRGPSVPLVR
jgi:2-polyprenyl-6-methoxyphenol hydroxylase-like FAD-dependent oxidoreductase